MGIAIPIRERPSTLSAVLARPHLSQSIPPQVTTTTHVYPPQSITPIVQHPTSSAPTHHIDSGDAHRWANEGAKKIRTDFERHAERYRTCQKGRRGQATDMGAWRWREVGGKPSHPDPRTQTTSWADSVLVGGGEAL